MNIDWENVSEILPKEIPALASDYRALIEHWNPERPGPHIVYGDILNPYLLSLLKTENDIRSLKTAFDLVERLAAHDDKRIQELVQVTICERLGNDKEALRVAQSYMGPSTKRLSAEIEGFWG